MNKVVTFFIIAILLFAGCRNESNKDNKYVQSAKTVSQLVTTAEGKTYLEVNGSPILYHGVQAWLPDDGNYELYMSKANDAGYDILTIWFPWRSIEPIQAEYDWSALDQLIEQAERYNMYLDIVWGGSNFCGGLDNRFAPDFIYNNPDFFLKSNDNKPVEIKKFDMGMCHIADYSNKELLRIESKTIESMMDYLGKRDTTNRVIFFQVQNEPNLFQWSQQDKNVVLNYCNMIGKVIKESDYSIATRMNLAGKEYEPLIDDLEYIDCHGVDIYTDDLTVLKASVTFDTKMPHIAENAAYENSSTLIALALALGGYYNIYRLDYDYVWDNPGVYGDGWIYIPQTFDVMLLNKGIRKISSQIAVSHSDNMLTFNTASKNPVAGYSEILTHKGFDIGFHSKSGYNEEAVGFALYFDGNYYLVADNTCTFSFSEMVHAETGLFDEYGNWITSSTVDVKLNSQERFEVGYNYYDCIKISQIHSKPTK